MDLTQFSNAVKQGVGGSQGFKSEFGLDGWINPAMDRAGKAIVGNSFIKATGVRADEEERRRQQAAKEQQMRMELENDPSKFQKLRKDDGGFAFYDPFGKEIDIDTYSKKTGQSRVDVLADSENPLDQQYRADWIKANEVGQAIYNNDIEAIQKYMAEEPEAFSRGKSYQSIMEQLIEKYPHIYGRGRYEDTMKSAGKPLFRQKSEVTSSVYDQLAQALSQSGQ